MTYTITETIEGVGWSEGVVEAPTSLVQKAKKLADQGNLVTFGRSVSGWVLLGIDSKQQLCVTDRADS